MSTNNDSREVGGMRPRVLRRRLTLAAFGAILAGATIGTGIARADVASMTDGVTYAVIDPVCLSVWTPAGRVGGVIL